MRINGFEQIKGFYSWVFSNQDKYIRTTHISLYMFLVNQNNRNSWVEWFKCPFDLAMVGSGISNKKTYYTTLLDLQDWGLIKYKKGVNNYKAPLIKLEVLFDTSIVPQSEPQLRPQVIPIPLPLMQPQLYKSIKLLTNNLEPITLNIEKILNFLKVNNNTNAYDYLIKINKEKIDIFEMQNKKSFPDYNKFIENFNCKVVEEKTEWDFDILLARLRRLNSNWDKTPRKNKEGSAMDLLREKLKKKTL